MKRRRLADDPPEINLIPMLDMVSLLIQLLLVNAQFGVFAEISTAMGAPTSQPLGGLQLRVDVTGQGFAVSWAGDDGRESRSLPCPGGCSGPESYDAAGLGAVAREIKVGNPDEQQVQLVMAPEVSFEVMAAAMDALRGPPEPDQALFPDVVLGNAGAVDGGAEPR